MSSSDCYNYHITNININRKMKRDTVSNNNQSRQQLAKTTQLTNNPTQITECHSVFANANIPTILQDHSSTVDKLPLPSKYSLIACHHNHDCQCM